MIIKKRINNNIKYIHIMKPLVNLNYFGRSKAWWVVLLIGILMVLCGFAYWFWPQPAYAVASQIFGWLLVLAGIVQLCAAAGPNRGKGWGWWIAGGVIDMFIGFLMVQSIIISEAVFPYFVAMIFLYWGISAICSAVHNNENGHKYWWLYLVNGILLLLIGFFLVQAGWVGDMMMVSFLTSLAFIYWGFSIAMFSYDMRPVKE
jgi:uncharacterized membrane protein HdeD (DUF308 family)